MNRQISVKKKSPELIWNSFNIYVRKILQEQHDHFIITDNFNIIISATKLFNLILSRAR